MAQGNNRKAEAMTRKDKIAQQLDALEEQGKVGGYYIQGGMPGLRWTVWGTFVGEHVYGAGSGMTAERSMSTREIEEMLS